LPELLDDLHARVTVILQVHGRVEQTDDAARHVQRAGAGTVESPPGPRLQELRNEYRLSHER
jgi:hypothetical protein